jgi:hypothetical protein
MYEKTYSNFEQQRQEELTKLKWANKVQSCIINMLWHHWIEKDAGDVLILMRSLFNLID